LFDYRCGVNLAGEADDDGCGEDEICELGFHGFVVIQGLDWVCGSECVRAFRLIRCGLSDLWPAPSTTPRGVAPRMRWNGLVVFAALGVG
jgi:hypothetical protein